MRERIRPRWYMGSSEWKGQRGKVQTESTLRRERRDGGLTLPEPILRLAQAEYDVQFPGQPYERMQERGGLGLLEVVNLLADRIERTEKLGPWKPAQPDTAGSGANPDAQQRDLGATYSRD